ncbi:MAG TPA: nitronate monooxygenase [Syntrophorhabdaceae bacterium]|nr:nitronate monooxygenase [Syntrophorhabdaceae bacterium]
MKNILCELLGIVHPVIQAPMNWITEAELAAAVSEAGGLGVIGPNAGERTQTDDVIETGERLRRQINKVRSATDKPFGVNLMTFFADHADNSNAFSDQCLKVILEEKVPVVVLAGSGPGEYTQRLKKEGVKVLFRPLRPTVATAMEAEQAGIDALITVGFEAGGHAGYDRIPTLVLIPQIVDAIHIPVVAGGGIVDGRGMAAAFALGAQGIFMGTRFVATKECSAHQNVKNAIVNATETSTVTVAGTVGILRALKGPVMERCMELEAEGGSLQELSNIYRPGYSKGMVLGDAAEGTFVCGAGAGLIKEIKAAADVVQDIVRDAEKIIAGLQDSI